jgi:hypothetical protein
MTANKIHDFYLILECNWRSWLMKILDCDTPSFSYLCTWNAVDYELIAAEQEEVVTDCFNNMCSMIETFHAEVADPEVLSFWIRVRDEVPRGWGRLRKEERHNLCCSPYSITAEDSWYKSQQQYDMFPSSKLSRTPVEGPCNLFSMGIGSFLPRVNWPGCKVDHSPQSAKVMNAWIYSSGVQCTFMARAGSSALHQVLG